MAGVRKLREVRSARGKAAMIGVLAAAICALSVVVGSSASAEQAQEPPFLLSPQLLQQTVTDPALRSGAAETDAEAAEELPHDDLDRDGALDLVRSVFSVQLEPPA